MLLLICLGHAAMLVFVVVDELPYLHEQEHAHARRSSDLVFTPALHSRHRSDLSSNLSSDLLGSPSKLAAAPARAADSRRELV